MQSKQTVQCEASDRRSHRRVVLLTFSMMHLDLLRDRWRTTVALLTLCASVSCTSGSGGNEWWLPSAASPALPSITSLSFDPPAIDGGASTRATITLGGPIPAGGATIALRAENGVASLPASVALTAGATTASFTVTTTAPAADTQVGVTATLGTQPFATALPVWVPDVNAMWVTRQDGGALAAMVRFSQPTAEFFAHCVNSGIDVTARRGSDREFIRVGAPAGSPVRPGSYSNDTAGSGWYLFPPGGSVSCFSGSRTIAFTISEVEVVSAAGTVPRLSLTFTNTCVNSNEVVRGGVRIVNPQSDASSFITPCAK